MTTVNLSSTNILANEDLQKATPLVKGVPHETLEKALHAYPVLSLRRDIASDTLSKDRSQFSTLHNERRHAGHDPAGKQSLLRDFADFQKFLKKRSELKIFGENDVEMDKKIAEIKSDLMQKLKRTDHENYPPV